VEYADPLERSYENQIAKPGTKSGGTEGKKQSRRPITKQSQKFPKEQGIRIRGGSNAFKKDVSSRTRIRSFPPRLLKGPRVGREPTSNMQKKNQKEENSDSRKRPKAGTPPRNNSIVGKNAEGENRPPERR